jgi:uncharacterized membrane protein YebE (DUF533 family)
MMRRRPLMRAAAVGGVAYLGAKAGTRSANAQQQQTEAQAPPPPPPAPAQVTDSATDRIAQIKQLAELHDSGALTDEEFAREKQKILG